MSTATPSDVSGVISTDLTDSEIQSFLDDAEFEAGQAIGDYNEWDTDRKTQLEKYVAALRIRQMVDKGISSTSRETASVTYEGSSVEALREQVNRRDPSNSLAYMSDSDRYVGST